MKRYTEQLLISDSSSIELALAILAEAGISARKAVAHSEFSSLVESEAMFDLVAEGWEGMTPEQSELLAELPLDIGVDSFARHLMNSGLFESLDEQVSDEFTNWLSFATKEAYTRCSFYLKGSAIEAPLASMSNSELNEVGHTELKKIKEKIKELFSIDLELSLHESEYTDGELQLFSHMYASVESILTSGRLASSEADVKTTIAELVETASDQIGAEFQIYDIEIQ